MKKISFIVLFNVLLFNNALIAQCHRAGVLSAVDEPDEYPVEGSVELRTNEAGETFVNFLSDFATIQGLELRVYLATTERLDQNGEYLEVTTEPLQDDNGGQDLGDSITGEKQFLIADSIRLEDYDYLIIQCVSADVLWGRAHFGGMFTGIIVKAGPDVLICSGDAAQLTATGAFQYSWSPATHLNNSNVPDPIAIPPQGQYFYQVIGYDITGQCADEDLVVVTVEEVEMQVSPNDTICQGENVQLQASGAPVFQWSPSAGLSDPFVPNPIAAPNITTTYCVRGQDMNGCEDTACVTIYVDNDCIVSTEDQLESDAFEFYPVPTDGMIYMTSEVDALKVIDKLGNVVFEAMNPPLQIDLTALKAGMYQLIVQKELHTIKRVVCVR